MDSQALTYWLAGAVILAFAGQVVVVRALARAWRVATAEERWRRRVERYCEDARREPCPRCGTPAWADGWCGRCHAPVAQSPFGGL